MDDDNGGSLDISELTSALKGFARRRDAASE